MPEPALLGLADVALKIVTKEIVYSNAFPINSWILTDTPTLESGTKMGFKYANVPSDYIKTGDRLHLVCYVLTGTKYQIEPVKSWNALETLPDKHNKSYYRLHDNTLYFKFPTGTTPDSLYVEHYQYPSLSEFPYEMVDALVGKVMSLLSGPAQAPPQPDAQQQQA